MSLIVEAIIMTLAVIGGSFVVAVFAYAVNSLFSKGRR